MGHCAKYNSFMHHRIQAAYIGLGSSGAVDSTVSKADKAFRDVEVRKDIISEIERKEVLLKKQRKSATLTRSYRKNGKYT